MAEEGHTKREKGMNRESGIRILWLAHARVAVTRTRTEHLVERLATRHHIDLVDFKRGIIGPACSLAMPTLGRTIERIEPFTHIRIASFPKSQSLKDIVMKRQIRGLLQDIRPAIVVASPAPYYTGWLPFEELRCPYVCDYLDGAEWQGEDPKCFEQRYVARSAATVCVSPGLVAQAERLCREVFYIPNGADRAWLSRDDRPSKEEAKRRLGLPVDAIAVSVIGLTCSRRLYFVDALAALRKKGINIIIFFVGVGGAEKEIRKSHKEHPEFVYSLGRIPYGEIDTAFFASDVGLNCNEEHSYYRFQSPIKIYEYLAAGVPVVTAPAVPDISRLRHPLVHECEPSTPAVEEALLHILERRGEESPGLPPDCDWDRLTEAFEEVLLKVAAKG